MAAQTQAIADQSLHKYGLRKALAKFDATLSRLYVGRSMSSLVTAAAFYIKLQMSGRDISKAGLTIPENYRGANGFPDKFRDSISPEEDQTHHAVAFISAGINDSRTGAKLHTWFDDRMQGNRGDAALSRVSYSIGQLLRTEPSRLRDIGAIINTNICLGQGA